MCVAACIIIVVFAQEGVQAKVVMTIASLHKQTTFRIQNSLAAMYLTDQASATVFLACKSCLKVYLGLASLPSVSDRFLTTPEIRLL